MGNEGSNIYKFLSEFKVTYIYLLIFILTLAPILVPIGIPISTTQDTKDYYDELKTLGPDDIVLVSWNIGFDALMELKSGAYVSMRAIIEAGAKMVHVFGHPEGPGMFPLIFGDPDTGAVGELSKIMENHDYTEGDDYIVLGYIMLNEASVVSIARDFHNYVIVDWKGAQISGTFLDEIEDPADLAMIIDFSAGFFSEAVVRHMAMDFGTPMIISSIGVSIAQNKLYVDAGYVSAILGSTRGGAEIEFLAGQPGIGLQAMDSFTIIHYFYILVLIMGNIAYFGYERHQYERRRTALR